MNSKQIVRELEGEILWLTTIIQNADKRLQSAPEGSVRINVHGKGSQFYRKMDSSNRNGTYMPVAERREAEALVQKNYDRRILSAAQKQVAFIERFIKNYQPDVLKTIYASLSEPRKRIVDPVELPDSEFRKEWESFTYQHKAFSEETPEHYSNRGERVRSKSEVMIADALDQAQIPYRYECPLKLGDTVVHPDFTILRLSDRKEIFWEHLGMMGDLEYSNHALQKIRLYERNRLFPGKELILTMETGLLPLNTAVIKDVIQQYCI